MRRLETLARTAHSSICILGSRVSCSFPPPVWRLRSITIRYTYRRVVLKVEGSVRFLDGVKNCTDSVHKFSRAFLLCYEFVQFLTPSKNLTDPSTFRTGGHRNDKKLSFMLEILMSGPLVYSQTTVQEDIPYHFKKGMVCQF
jgi:hypothetical protein